MAFRANFALTGMRESLDFQLEVIERSEIGAMDRVQSGLKEELRDQIVAAGLGQRMAKTWRGRVYENKGGSSGPAAFVYSKAPDIVSLFASGAVTRAVNGARYLWMPTANVPRGRRSKAMLPEEVEARYGAFIYRPSKRTPGNFVALVQPVKRGRPRRRRAGDPAPALVHMFTLSLIRHGTKSLELDGPASRWADQGAGFIETGLEGEA